MQMDSIKFCQPIYVGVIEQYLFIEMTHGGIKILWEELNNNFIALGVTCKKCPS
jgi:hypothetical protein